MSRHFLRRLYPIELLEEAAILARRQDRDILLHKEKETKRQEDCVFLINTYHPTDTSVVDVVRQNWDMLGKSPTTQFIHSKRLLCGYRRPKNLRDFLVRAAIPYKPGDEQNDPDYVPPRQEEVKVTTMQGNQGKSVQTKMHDFFQKRDLRTMQVAEMPSTSTSTDTVTTNVVKLDNKSKGTSQKERGFNFCNRNSCRYCPKLNKTGKIICSVTGQSFDCMKNVSCRSSNLVYAATCKICKKQYVGQTLLRVKDRFVKHFFDIDKEDRSKALGLHFSKGDHNGIQDVQITVLEFIKKPPRSPEAAKIRDRVEKRWIHLLRCPAPQGLNMFDYWMF
jgi:hypothetical protein